MTRLHIGFISALFLTLTLTASAGASNDIRIATWITPENGPAPGQKLDLNIKVATLEKLESGVRIEDLVLPDAVVLQRQKFATNATEIRNGQTWNVQDWTVSIFPLKAGDIFIPSLEVQIPVKRVESGGSNFIKRQTKPRLITISRPPALRGLDQWIASPAFELRQTISANDDRIEPGSVIRRKIHLRADNVPGMLLPEPIQAPINGLREYPATSTSEDFEDRGQLIGRRSLEHTYVVEKTGTYALPEIRIAWWHTETKTLQWATVPAYSFVVSSVVSVKSPIGPFGIIGAVLLTAAILTVMLNPNTRRQVIIWLSFHGALARKNWSGALGQLYRLLEQSDNPAIREHLTLLGHKPLINEFDTLMEASYGTGQMSDRHKIMILMKIFWTIARAAQHSHRAQKQPDQNHKTDPKAILS